jgi:hypothetical protein
MDKHLFAFLKDRKVFTQSGDTTLREALTAMESRQLNRLRERKHYRKPTKK